MLIHSLGLMFVSADMPGYCYWKQGDPAWGSTKLGDATLGSVGCVVTSIAVLMRESGISTLGGSELNPGTLGTYLNSKGVFNSGGAVSAWSAFNDAGVGFKWYKQEKGLSGEATFNAIIALLNQGVFVALRCGDDAHSVAVIGNTDNSLTVAEVAKGTVVTLTKADFQANSGLTSKGMYKDKVCGYHAFITGTDIGYAGLSTEEDGSGTGGDRGTGNRKLSSEEKAVLDLNYGVLKESAAFTGEFGGLSESVILPDGAEFKNKPEANELNKWLRTLNLEDADRTAKTVRVVFMFTGILVVVYSVLLFLSFEFDSMNNFLDIDLLSIVSFGRLKRAGEGESGNFRTKESKGKDVNMRDILQVSLIGVAVGILILSGRIYWLIFVLTDWVRGWFGR